MDANRFDEVARRFGRRLGRRRVLATLGAGLGLATLGWLRPLSAAARPYCGNCDDICAHCDETGNEFICNLCATCDFGWCYECPGPAPCDGQ